MSEAKKGGFFNRFLGSPRPADVGSRKKLGPMLPFGVRYALEYGGGLGREDIRELVDCGESTFTPSAIYIVTKALEGEPKKQGMFLEAIANVSLNRPTDVAQVILETIDNLPPVTTVPAAKLAQFSRQGFDTWENLFISAAQACRQGGETPILVAHVMVAGIGHFLRETNGSIVIVNPRWVEDHYSFLCGFVMAREGGAIGVSPLFRDFERPKAFKIIDDTRKTGSTIQRVWSFVTGTQDIDESRIKVLCNVQ